jgi:hypothetical protein
MVHTRDRALARAPSIAASTSEAFLAKVSMVREMLGSETTRSNTPVAHHPDIGQTVTAQRQRQRKVDDHQSVPTDRSTALEENDMTAIYTFDDFSSLDGYGAASGNWGDYWGKCSSTDPPSIDLYGLKRIRHACTYQMTDSLEGCRCIPPQEAPSVVWVPTLTCKADSIGYLQTQSAP